MDITHEWVKVVMAIAGILSVYLGYTLFCDLSYRSTRSKRSILLTNLVSGALLAIFGLGILIADARSIQSTAHDSKPSWQKKKTTKEGSFENRHDRVSERLALGQKPDPAISRSIC